VRHTRATVTLVLMTPIGLDAACWDGMRLPDRRTARHEFPGFGGRPRAEPPPTMAALADEVAAAYEAPLDLVGVSLGGMVGQHVAVRHPGRVRSLLTACTGAAANRQVMEQRAASAEAGGMEAVVETTLERWFTPEALASDGHPGVDYARRTLLRLDPGAFADGWRAIAGHDVRDGLPDVRVPVTAVAGAADTASPVERAQEIADRVPTSRLVVLDGPHMMHLERPAELSAAIAEHLRWVDEVRA
jgi:3-oxoadipate enol-lactonase